MVPKPITLKSLLITAAVVVGVEFVARIVIAQGGLHPMIGLGLARLVQIILLLLIVITLEKDFASIGIVGSQLTAGIRKGIIWSLGFGIATGVVFIILWAVGFQVSAFFQAPIPLTHGDIFLFIAVGALIAPVAEEIFFRGILYGFFRQWGLTMALVISTALFVLSHTTGSGLPITQLIGGLLFAVAYEKEKNLIVPIIIHSLGNLAIFCLSYLLQS
jgi:membrane protease YdiL (CAAX protease family)